MLSSKDWPVRVRSAVMGTTGVLMKKKFSDCRFSSFIMQSQSWPLVSRILQREWIMETGGGHYRERQVCNAPKLAEWWTEQVKRMVLTLGLAWGWVTGWVVEAGSQAMPAGL